MARGDDINIGIAGDASKFVRETKNVEGALDDVADALDDMARDAQSDARKAERAVEGLGDTFSDTGDEAKDAGRDAERSFSDIVSEVRDAERAVNKLEDSFSDARKKAQDLGTAGKDAGDDIRQGAREAGEGVGDFKDEAKSNAQEVASSFDGSAESIADGFQGLAATAFAGFGPAGVVAGLAAAAGIGLASQGFADAAEAQEASEEAIAEWADKFIEAGGRVMSAAQLVGEVTAIATDPERYKEAAENAKNWGVDESTAMRAMAGDATALAVVKKTLNDRTEKWNEILRESVTGSGNSYDKMRALTDQERELADQTYKGREAFDKLNGEMTEGAKRADTVSDAYLAIIDDAKDATIQVDKLGNKVVTLPDDTQIFIDAKTGQASQAVDRFKGDLNEIPSKKAVTVNGSVSLDKNGLTRQINSYRAPTVYIPGKIVGPGGRQML